MKVAVMGTGMVGRALAGRLSALGHEVMMGSRDGSTARAWAEAEGALGGTYAEAAAWGELVIFATQGAALLDAARAAGSGQLDGKVVIDVTNPLDMSGEGLPTLIPALSNTTSAGEELQKAHPGARVVKTLNTMTCAIMIAPARVPGAHDVFLCGNDQAAKAEVGALLGSFGWAAPIDLGPIEAARGLEGLMPLWLRLWRVLGSADFNFRVAR